MFISELLKTVDDDINCWLLVYSVQIINRFRDIEEA